MVIPSQYSKDSVDDTGSDSRSGRYRENGGYAMFPHQVSSSGGSNPTSLLGQATLFPSDLLSATDLMRCEDSYRSILTSRSLHSVLSEVMTIIGEDETPSPGATSTNNMRHLRETFARNNSGAGSPPGSPQ